MQEGQVRRKRGRPKKYAASYPTSSGESSGRMPTVPLVDPSNPPDIPGPSLITIRNLLNVAAHRIVDGLLNPTSGRAVAELCKVQLATFKEAGDLDSDGLENMTGEEIDRILGGVRHESTGTD